MRNLVLSVATMFAIAAVACGPSSKEVATAKSARYQGDQAELIKEIKAATEGKYKIVKADELTVQTEPRWFSPEGLGVTPRGDDMRDVPDKSINIALVIALVPAERDFLVKVTPVMARYNVGIPKPEQVKEDDPSLPGWVQGKVDELALAVHTQLSKYEVKTVPGMVPPPSEASPASPPPSPAPADPAAGSATPQ